MTTREKIEREIRSCNIFIDFSIQATVVALVMLIVSIILTQAGVLL